MSSSVLTLQTRSARRSAAGAPLTVRPGRKDQVRFGDSLVTSPKPSKTQIKQNVDFSSAALARASGKLMNPGVRLYPKKDVPLFFADPENPEGFLRKLNGRVQRGVLKDGQFEAID